MKIPTAWQREIDAGSEFGLRASIAADRLERRAAARDSKQNLDGKVSTKSRSARPVDNRVGTVLHRLLRDRFGAKIAKCKCQEWIDRMNAWGPDGCTEHLDEIVEHLIQEARTNEQASYFVRFALKVPVIGEREGRRRITGLVNEAITMATGANPKALGPS
ncbi:MAG: hypothetical protein O2856_19530 [Planctomycetota bacterium]|nr:hypothetical protein [Planctomycetota bacterium]